MSHGHNTPAGEPQAIDPENDIDAKAVIITAVVVVFSFALTMWILAQLFAFVVHNERLKKVEQAPTPMLDQVRIDEQKNLKGIDAAIKKLSKD